MTTTSSNNFTGLYGSGTATVNPNTAYGNANVVSLLATSTDGANTIGNISATGNVAGTYFIGNGSQLTGLPVTYGNANVVGLLSSGTDGANTVSNIVASGNVTGSYFIGDGSLLTNVISTAALTGNMSGNIAGNGFSLNNIQTESILGNLTVSGNIRANVAGPKIYANTVVFTGEVAGGQFVSAQAFYSTEDTSVGRDLSVVGNISTYGAANNINLSTSSGAGLDLPSSGNVTFSAGGTGNTAITILGNLRIVGNITHPVNALANISTSQYFIGDGSLLTNLPAGNYNNANVSTFLAAFGSNTISTTGNVTAGYFLGDGSQLANLPAGNYNNANVSTFLAAFGSNSISTTGNVTAGYVIGNGSLLTSLTGGNVTGTVANATYAVSAGSATTAVTVTANAQPNITSVGTLTSLSSSGNITAGSGSFFLGNGSQLTGITASGSDTQVQYNNAGALAGTNLMLIGPSANTVTIGAGTAFAGSTVINSGTEIGLNANVAGAPVVMGNIRANGSIITNTNTWTATTNPSLNRIVIGSGYNGDYTNTYDAASVWRGSQLAVVNNYKIANADTQQNVQQFSSYAYFDLQGATLTNTTRRTRGGLFVSHFGNGTMSMATSGYLGASGGGSSLLAGNIGGATVGNVVLTQASSALNYMGVGTGGNIQSGIVNYNLYQAITTGAVIGNVLAAASQFTGTPTTPPTTVVGYYMPGTTSNYGITNSNTFRAATNYYFLKNEDSVARNQMGSLETYTEYSALNGSTSGTIDVNKNNGQVQQWDLTGNATLTVSNFVTTASDGTNTDLQADTVTVIINQGATGGYGVTFPTPSSVYKYAGNVTSLQSTAANSVSMVSITGVYMNSQSTYLITISPGFV